jgi:hypothetical protein
MIVDLSAFSGCANAHLPRIIVQILSGGWFASN